MPQGNIGRQNKHSMGFPVGTPAPYRSKQALCPGMSTAEALCIRHALDEQQASNEQVIA